MRRWIVGLVAGLGLVSGGVAVPVALADDAPGGYSAVWGSLGTSSEVVVTAAARRGDEEQPGWEMPG